MDSFGDTPQVSERQPDLSQMRDLGDFLRSVGKRPSVPTDKNASKPKVLPELELYDSELTVADRLIADPYSRERFKSDTATFLNRAKKARLPHSEVSQLITQVNVLLEPTDSSRLPQQRREMLARQIMHHAADPTSIDQGSNPTCTVNAAEVVLFARRPGESARMLRHLADTLEYSTRSGMQIRLNPEAMTPDTKAQNDHIYDDERSYASQIFQSALINAGMPAFDPQNNGRYDYYPARRARSESNWEVPAFRGFPAEATTAAIRAVEPNLGEMVYLSDRNIISEMDLVATLKTLKAQNALPVIIEVSQSAEPFRTELRRKPRPGSTHVVTAWDIDSSNRVKIDNSWGSSNDHMTVGIPASQLFDAMQIRQSLA